MVEDIRLTWNDFRKGGSGFDEHVRIVIGDGYRILSTIFGVGTISLSMVFQDLYSITTNKEAMVVDYMRVPDSGIVCISLHSSVPRLRIEGYG